MSEAPAPSGFYTELTEEERGALRSRGRRRRYPRGAALFREGERSDGVVLVLSGRVKISYFTDAGQEIVLAVRGAGEVLGELSTLDGEPRSATGTALGPVEAVVVGAGDFTAFLEAYPRVALILLRTVGRRLREANRRRVEFGAYDTAARLARRLADLAEQFGEEAAGGIAIPLPLTQQELAGWIGASREAVSKALRSLRARGWIETHRRRVLVRDLAALRRRAT